MFTRAGVLAVVLALIGTAAGGCEAGPGGPGDPDPKVNQTTGADGGSDGGADGGSDGGADGGSGNNGDRPTTTARDDPVLGAPLKIPPFVDTEGLSVNEISGVIDTRLSEACETESPCVGVVLIVQPESTDRDRDPCRITDVNPPVTVPRNGTITVTMACTPSETTDSSEPTSPDETDVEEETSDPASSGETGVEEETADPATEPDSG